MKPFKTTKDVKTRSKQALKTITDLTEKTSVMPRYVGVKVMPHMCFEAGTGLTVYNHSPNPIFFGYCKETSELVQIIKPAKVKPTKEVKRKNGF